jgi:Rrf2 family protein
MRMLARSAPPLFSSRNLRVIFSNPTEYAIRALSELVLMIEGIDEETVSAAPRKRNYVMLNNLIERTTLPREFMAKIFRQLVEGGVLTSAKGPGGGFSLARPADQITLLDVIEAVDGSSPVEGCVVGLGRCSDGMPCPQHELIKPLRQRFRAYLANTTLADTADSLRAKKAMTAKESANPPKRR